MKVFLMMVLCLCTVTLTGMAGVEKQVDRVIEQQGIVVQNDQEMLLDSLSMILSDTGSTEVAIDDLTPMIEGDGWFKRNWKWLLSLVLVLLEIIVKVKPTGRDWSLVNKLLSVLLWLWRRIPNNAKINGEVVKRGFDLRTKRIVDKLKK